jgi:hypothetical protein
MNADLAKEIKQKLNGILEKSEQIKTSTEEAIIILDQIITEAKEPAKAETSKIKEKKENPKKRGPGKKESPMTEKQEEPVVIDLEDKPQKKRKRKRESSQLDELASRIGVYLIYISSI